MNADLKIAISVKSTKRKELEPFRPTEINNYAWGWDTDLESYTGVTGSIANSVMTFIINQRALGYENTVHIDIRLSNPTHPTPAKGVIPLAKGHRNLTLDDLSIVSGTVIQDSIDEAIEVLQKTAKY